MRWSRSRGSLKAKWRAFPLAVLPDHHRGGARRPAHGGAGRAAVHRLVRQSGRNRGAARGGDGRPNRARRAGHAAAFADPLSRRGRRVGGGPRAGRAQTVVRKGAARARAGQARQRKNPVQRNPAREAGADPRPRARRVASARAAEGSRRGWLRRARRPRRNDPDHGPGGPPADDRRRRSRCGRAVACRTLSHFRSVFRSRRRARRLSPRHGKGGTFDDSDPGLGRRRPDLARARIRRRARVLRRENPEPFPERPH